jgi:uncharacterized RDD family membrane protein YckC
METINYESYNVIGRRFLAYVIDGIVLLLISCCLLAVCGALVIILFLSASHHAVGKEAIEAVIAPLIENLYCLIQFIGHWLYYALFESSKLQATPGKLICSIKVTDIQGQRLSFARATGRSFAKYLSAFTCLIGYIMAAFTLRRQALHDIIASTVVIKNVIINDDAANTGKIFV